MLCLKSFIQELISIYENTFKRKILLVINNFEDDFNDNDN